MSKLKDKLSANMRMVKASQQSPAAKPTHASAPAKPAHKAAEKPVAAPARHRTSASGDSLRDEVPSSASELFPTRVWPD